MRIFSVVGISKSGKTTTIEKIIEALRKKGYTVGSVKEIHNENFSMDTDGTNTYRHKKAGSMLVTARGLYETDILYQKKLGIEQILSHYANDYGCEYDYVVLEGVRDVDVPNIITAHEQSEIDERVNEKTFLISGRISESIKFYKSIEVVNALTDVDKIIDILEKNVKEFEIKTKYNVINGGQKTPLTAYQSMMLERIIGRIEFEQIVKD